MAEQVAMLIDTSRCMGCRGCQVACKQWNQLPAEETKFTGSYQNPPNLTAHTWTLINFVEPEDFDQNPRWLFRKEQCFHCTDASCAQVCPTGAITQLTLKEKAKTQIARAKVRRDACIAWEDGAVCMVCDEYCPYSAIDVEYRPSDIYRDVPLPVISPQRCRGCGYCRKVCLSEHPDKAIDLLAIEKQPRAVDELSV